MHTVIRQNGFTLIEAAVVLVIIGVILASVLQGRELIANAQYRSFSKDLGDYAEAFKTFRDRYNALPGDLADAVATADLGQDGGDGDGVIDGGPTCNGAGEESCLSWQHLRAASLIKGNPHEAGEAARPSHPYNGHVSGFFTGAQGDGDFRHKVLVESIPAHIGRRLDDELDDGLCDRGRVSIRSGCSSGDWPDDGDVELIYAL